MRRILLLGFLLYISGCSITGSIVTEPKLEGPYLVTKVVDGDTADLEGLGRVRFSGINTPEKGDCYYKEASGRLKDLILDEEVYVEKDKSDRDKYDRYLRYIYVNGTFVNGVLVEEGYAKVFDKYKYDTRRYYQLKQLEKIAVDNSLGVWDCN